MDVPDGLRYTKEHEWVRVEGSEAVIGITDYAQGELGDIVFVDLPDAGRVLRQMQPFGTIEAVKAVSDLFSPVTGEVTAVNEALRDDPSLVNRSPFKDGWMVRARFTNAAEIESLLTPRRSIAHSWGFDVEMHPYLGTCKNDRKQMLEYLGVSSIEEILRPIPDDVRLKRPLDLPRGASELDVRREIGSLARRNWDSARYVSFLGGGAYDHYIPSAVNHLASRSEFYTAYTPYQAEASQGTLMAIFEFQSMICELLAMDASNASLYDGASGVAEAALLGLRIKPGAVVHAAGLHPEYRRVLKTYLAALGEPIRSIPAADGVTDTAAMTGSFEGASVVIVQNPNFFGLIEPVEAIARAARAAGALVVAVVDPLSLGILSPPGEWGADVAVGEGQGLGNELSFGGPYLGFLGARREHLRRLPGRIAGVTSGVKGERGFVLTLQTREQHIRREKATSNICTNQGLMMLRATIYLALMGKHGIVDVGRQCLAKAHYAADRIAKVPGYKLRFKGPFFKEFVVDCPVPAAQVIDAAAAKGILAGVDLGWFGMERSMLVAVTEKRTKEEIDSLAAALAEVSR